VRCDGEWRWNQVYILSVGFHLDGDGMRGRRRRRRRRRKRRNLKFRDLPVLSTQLAGAMVDDFLPQRCCHVMYSFQMTVRREVGIQSRTLVVLASLLQHIRNHQYLVQD
jgi:hypothetical protein